MLSSTEEQYVVKLSTGQFYQGKDEAGEPQWTRVPRWAKVLTAGPELSELLESLEKSEHDFTVLVAR